MPLTFDERGLLPPGIHEASLIEVEEAFAQVQHTDRRMNLFAKFQEWFAALRRTRWACQVILDGSFVMPMIDDPNDLDLILVMPGSWDMAADLRPFEYNVVDKHYTKREYHIEVYPVVPDSVDYHKFLTLFTRIRLEWCQRFDWLVGSQKGVVRLLP